MKYPFLSLVVFSTSSFAVQVIDNNCKLPTSGTGIIMMDKMHEEMHIDIKNIQPKNITTELLYNEPVSDILSQYYAERTYETDSSLSIKKNKGIYSEHNPRNLTIKFTFKNNKGKEDIFLVSTIANDYECNVEFNGYIIVKREF